MVASLTDGDQSKLLKKYGLRKGVQLFEFEKMFAAKPIQQPFDIFLGDNITLCTTQITIFDPSPPGILFVSSILYNMHAIFVVYGTELVGRSSA